jgi:K+-sensing histidine kinase KdpD
MSTRRVEQWVSWTVALAGPPVVTAVLVNFSNQIQRDYVFIYLGLVAIVGVFRGLWPALACAAMSFLLVDYFFVPPVATLVRYIRSVSATEVVLGHRKHWRPWGTTTEVIASLDSVDVHILRARAPLAASAN